MSAPSRANERAYAGLGAAGTGGRRRRRLARHPLEVGRDPARAGSVAVAPLPNATHKRAEVVHHLEGHFASGGNHHGRSPSRTASRERLEGAARLGHRLEVWPSARRLAATGPGARTPRPTTPRACQQRLARFRHSPASRVKKSAVPSDWAHEAALSPEEVS
jgi:hypothetical protein